MNTPYTNTQLRRAYALARLRGKLRPELVEDPNSLPLTLIPRRSVVKEQRSASKRMTKQRQPFSVMNMGQPARHRLSVPRDDRTERLFRAHDKRKAAGWIRG